MGIDSGAHIESAGYLATGVSSAYAFGISDFTVEAMFLPLVSGPLVSCHSADKSGWSILLAPNGTLTFSISGSSGFQVVTSGPTKAFDGEWHHIAVVRRGMEVVIYLDDCPLRVTSRESSTNAVNLSGPSSIVIGALGDGTNDVGQSDFIGTIDDVAIWSRALSAEDILPTMFNGLRGNEPGLVGYWDLNSNAFDAVNYNNAWIVGDVSFVPISHCIWVDGANHYAYCEIDSHFDEIPASRSRAGYSVEVTRKQTVNVAAGTPFLYAVINNHDNTLGFPEDIHLAITRPDGTLISGPSGTDHLHVLMSGTSIWQMLLRDPMPGPWVVTITGPSTIDFRFWMQTVPSTDIVTTITTALASVNADHAQSGNLKRDISSYHWGSLAMMGGAFIVAGAAMVSAPPLLPAALIVALTGVVVEQGIFLIETMLNLPTVTAGSEVLATAVGFDPNDIAEYGLALSGGYVSANSNAAYNFGVADFSFEAWVKPTKPGPILGRKSTDGGAGNAGFLFQVNPNGILSLITDSGFGSYRVDSVQTKMFDGSWHHVAVTRATGLVKLYFDGQELVTHASSDRASTPVDISNQLPLLIGSVAQTQQENRFYQGLISELRIWDHARTPSEVKAFMNLCVDPMTPTIVGYWPFVTGDSRDISRAGNNGTILGGVHFVSQPGEQLVEIQLGRNAASGYEYVGEHTFICIMNSTARTASYPENVARFFDCAGGHGDEAGHAVPVNLGSLVVRGRTNDLITMATGSKVIDPTKVVYGSGSEFGFGTCGIRPAGKIRRNGFCHQIANRLLYAATWPNRQVTLKDAVPQVRGYWITVAWTGVYGQSWASIWEGKEVSFAEWCAKCGFPAPKPDDEALANELRDLAPDKRRAFQSQSADLSSTVRPDATAEELQEAEDRFRANMAQLLPDDDRLRMGI